MLGIIKNLTRNAIRKNGLSPRAIQLNLKFRDIQFRRSSEMKCETPEYVTRIAVPSDYPYVLDFMCEHYFTTEPALVNIGLASQEPSPILVDMMQKQIKEGMTIITLNEKGCIMGAVINGGTSPWYPDELREAANCADNKDVARLLRFCAKIAEAPDPWKTHHTNKVFECAHMTVDPQYRGKGIGTKLVSDSWMLARDLGSRVFRMDCTSKFTAKTAQKIGLEYVMSIPFSSYVECDEFVFKNIKKPHDSVDIYLGFPSKPKQS
ncbi:dopamine N-acetyltransferase-like [Fopius arisanus]|uniref:aralkylamine N-acetyltransferase n=1 Tax=Fopius arisanus TaxID=64838 RepID=A0A9R1T577_9HYME|nr:PREDICTED: dopamine N-acetyltransferase-like [Fopius arisanus]XP_011302866.1 PREDICTED: dopamine N-acetyltransferase-like [Fopius arisanus]